MDDLPFSTEPASAIPKPQMTTSPPRSSPHNRRLKDVPEAERAKDREMQSDAECKDSMNEFGGIGEWLLLLLFSHIYLLWLVSDWNLLNEALLDDDELAGFSTEQSMSPTSPTRHQKPLFPVERKGSRSVLSLVFD
jgi:hypothetical protein